MSDTKIKCLTVVVSLVLVIGAYLFANVHEEVQKEMVKTVPLIITAAFAGTGVVLTAIGYQQNRRLLAGHNQLAQTVRDEGAKVDSTVRLAASKVAVVTVKKAQETQDRVEEVHKQLNGGPEGIGAQLKSIIAEALKEVIAQATERVAASGERGHAREARERVSGKKETDQAIPTAAHTQLVEDLKEMKE